MNVTRIFLIEIYRNNVINRLLMIIRPTKFIIQESFRVKLHLNYRCLIAVKLSNISITIKRNKTLQICLYIYNVKSKLILDKIQDFFRFALLSSEFP